MTDLNSPGVAKQIANKVLKDIDSYCVKTYDGGFRWHLGGSLIGESCSRKLWYGFRWAIREEFDGRKLRLFNRGHREEDRFIEWLRGAGFQVWTHEQLDEWKLDENGQPALIKEGKQFKISTLGGHFGGSLDGIARFPESYKIAEPILLEFKTNGTGKGFTDLKDKGMAVAKPMHFAQTCTYGVDTKYNFNWVLYMNICKNDDDMHVELVKLDHKIGNNMRAKAEQIIMSESAPPRLSDNPTFFDCKYCACKKVCHEGQLPERNCRSCSNVTPVENGEWSCKIHNGLIPREFVSQACPQYNPIK